jgi:hypothetical protein
MRLVENFARVALGTEGQDVLSKKPSKPPLPKLHDDEEDRHDSGNATIVGKVDPALLRAAGRTRPAIPRPDPKSSAANKAPAPATAKAPHKPSDPFAKPTAPPPAPAPSAGQEQAIATPLASPSPFLDLELDLDEAPKAPAKAPPLPPEATKAKKPSSRPKAPEPEPTKKALPMSRDSGEHTVAVRGFVLPKAAIPSASPLGSDFDIPAQKAAPEPAVSPARAAPSPAAAARPAAAPGPAAARAPEPMLEAPPASSGPSKFPSDITIMAVGGSATPSAPAAASPAPVSAVSSPSPPSSQGAAKAPAANELGRSTKPTLLVDRVTLLAARAVDKRASIVIAYVDGNTDIDTIAENTGFLPSETLEIVRSLVAKGILSIK